MYIVVTCETQVQEKTRWKRKIAAPTASFSVKSGHHGFGGIGAVETTDREAGSWNSWAIATHAGNGWKNCPQVSAIKFRFLFLSFYKKYVTNLFSTRRESLAQTYHPIFWGIAFFISSATLTYLLYYVMERAAKACEEPENPWNGKNRDISNVQVFPIPDLQK